MNYSVWFWGIPQGYPLLLFLRLEEVAPATQMWLSAITCQDLTLSSAQTTKSRAAGQSKPTPLLCGYYFPCKAQRLIDIWEEFGRTDGRGISQFIIKSLSKAVFVPAGETHWGRLTQHYINPGATALHHFLLCIYGYFPLKYRRLHLFINAQMYVVMKWNDAHARPPAAWHDEMTDPSVAPNGKTETSCRLRTDVYIMGLLWIIMAARYIQALFSCCINFLRNFTLVSFKWCGCLKIRAVIIWSSFTSAQHVCFKWSVLD